MSPGRGWLLGDEALPGLLSGSGEPSFPKHHELQVRETRRKAVGAGRERTAVFILEGHKSSLMSPPGATQESFIGSIRGKLREETTENITLADHPSKMISKALGKSSGRSPPREREAESTDLNYRTVHVDQSGF